VGDVRYGLKGCGKIVNKKGTEPSCYIDYVHCCHYSIDFWTLRLIYRMSPLITKKAFLVRPLQGPSVEQKMRQPKTSFMDFDGPHKHKQFGPSQEVMKTTYIS
jgi:hypothetical protein